jgi:hypothetical protein
MKTAQSQAARAIGGWAVLADFSGLLVKAAVVGLAVSLLAGGLVLLVAV